MGALLMDGVGGPAIESAEQMLGLFAGGVGGRLAGWQERLGMAYKDLQWVATG